jgi:CHAT domain-containing protein/tetratricopeptide (TPR) repeat protein
MPRPSRRLLACLGALAGCAGGAIGLFPDEPTLPSPRARALARTPRSARVFALRPGVGRRRAIAGGAVHVLRFRAAAGRFVALLVEQEGADVAVTIVEPSGHRLPPVDSPTGAAGTERVLFLARQAGTYRAVVRAWRSRPDGAYLARLTLRPPTARDRLRAAAEGAFYAAKARAHRRGDTRADRAVAAAGYRAAAERFAALGEWGRERDAWNGLGDLAAAADDWRGAGAASARVLPLARALGDQPGEARADNELGRSAEEREELGTAAAAYRRALPLWQAVGDGENEARTWINLGHIAAKERRAADAVSSFDRALALGRQAGTRALALTGRGQVRARTGPLAPALADFRQALALLGENDIQLRAVALAEMGNAYLEAGAEPLALARFASALALARRAGDRATEAVILSGRGLAHLRRREHAAAEADGRKALALFAAQGSRRGQAAALVNLGWTAASQGRTKAALAAFGRALPRLCRLGQRAARAAKAALHLGRAWAERAHPRPARAEAEAGAALAAGLPGDPADFYDLLVDLRMAEHRAAPRAGHDAQALSLHERSRGRALVETLAGPGAEPLSLGGIERLVADGRTLLLEYRLGEERSFLWAVSAEGLESFELPARRRIEPLVRQLFALLAGGDRRSRRGAARRSAAALGRLLLGPVAGRLGDRPLLLVPDGVLFYVPWAALPDPGTVGPGPGEDGWPAPLALHHEMTEIASVSALAALRRARRGEGPPPGGLALLTAPATDSGDPDPSLPAERAGGTFPLLPGSAAEGERIARIADRSSPGSVLRASGFDASRERVLSGELGGYRFLHLSAHGRVDPVHPEGSALVLALRDPRGRLRNGYLRAGDLAGLRFPADLVTLAGCETALGKELPGEGLAGLSRAFLAAGAARVLGSLWQVDDSSTAVLMERLYRGLFEGGLRPAAALRAAQVSMWREARFRSPYHWAGFVLQGDPR